MKKKFIFYLFFENMVQFFRLSEPAASAERYGESERYGHVVALSVIRENKQ